MHPTTGKYIHEIDNFLFVNFFNHFLLKKFEELYAGCKRFNWIPDTLRGKVFLFYQEYMGLNLDHL